MSGHYFEVSDVQSGNAVPDLAHSRPGALPLPRMTMQEAEALNVIARHALDYECSAIVEQCRFSWRLSLSRGRGEVLRADCDREAWIEWSGARFRVLFAARAANAWLSWRLGAEASSSLDSMMCDAALDAMLHEAIDSLALGGLGMPRLVSIRPRDADGNVTNAADADPQVPGDANVTDGLRYAFVLVVQASTGMAEGAPTPTACACIDVDGFGLILMASLLARAPISNRFANQFDVASLPLNFRLVIGHATPSLSELSGLSVGDWIRCADCSLQGDTTSIAATALDGQVWRFALNDDSNDSPDISSSSHLCERNDDQDDKQRNEQDHVQSEMDECSGNDGDATAGERIQKKKGMAPRAAWCFIGRESAVLTNDEAAAAMPVAPDLSQLPVHISFDLGTVSVSLAELTALQIGEVFALDCRLDAPVRIRANGMLIGEGELAEIDGKLGVVVATLFASHTDRAVNPEPAGR